MLGRFWMHAPRSEVKTGNRVENTGYNIAFARMKNWLGGNQGDLEKGSCPGGRGF